MDKSSYLILVVVSVISATLFSGVFNGNGAYAALTQDHVNQLKGMFRSANNDIQNNSTDSASTTLENVNANLTKYARDSCQRAANSLAI